MARTPVGQADLLDWQAPVPVMRFDDADVRAVTLNARLAKAVAAALAGHDRAAVARTMTDILGRAVSKAMVDAYASVARDDHVISAPRFQALVQATADRRLVQMMAEPIGCAVIERRYLPLIQLAAVRRAGRPPAPRARGATARNARGWAAVRTPGYWMHETSGVLRPVIEVYLGGGQLDEPQLAIMRSYLAQWMDSPWEPEDRIQVLRDQIGGLTSTDDVHQWLDDALDLGIDPL